jgi:hypothetical protein
MINSPVESFVRGLGRGFPSREPIPAAKIIALTIAPLFLS